MHACRGISYLERVCMVLEVKIKYTLNILLRTFRSLCLSWGAKIPISPQRILFHFFVIAKNSKMAN